jgi:ankyrin repeat protein
LIVIITLQLAFPPAAVTPLEETLRNPDDLQPLINRLAENPPQAERDAAFHWALASDFGKFINGPGTRRVQALAAAGANVNKPDAYGTTPLMQAVHVHDSDSLVDLLVHAGADVNAHDSTGKSILSMARESGASPHVIQTLTAAGARP